MPAGNGEGAKEPAVRASDEQIWRWLGEVPDPEIPVISIVDLGIVRAIAWEDDTLVVTVTPTYSGCPATRVINDDIVAHLMDRGIAKLRMQRQLSPAWTTAWLSRSGHEKLRAYGIAPPADDMAAGDRGAASVSFMAVPAPALKSDSAAYAPSTPPLVHCPRCDARDAERISQFGSTPCKASYRCRACLEPFDYFKCI